MSEENRQPSLDINAIATKMSLDNDFAKLILDPSTRVLALKSFPQLSEKTTGEIVRISATTMQEFIQQLLKILKSK